MERQKSTEIDFSADSLIGFYETFYLKLIQIGIDSYSIISFRNWPKDFSITTTKFGNVSRKCIPQNLS